MRRTRSLAILAVFLTASALSLTSCRTESSTRQTESQESRTSPPDTASASPAPPQEPSAIHDPRPLIICFGDSLTAGYGTEPGQSYPDFLQADLDAKGFHYRVVNRGISGNTTKDGVERVNTILAMRPAVVIVEFGGNDGLRGLPIADSRSNLDQIVSTLKAGGVKVVLAGITLPPDYGPDYIKQFDATYTVLAKKYNVPLLPFLLRGVFGKEGMMQADQTHATAAGNRVVAQNVLPLVTQLLKK